MSDLYLNFEHPTLQGAWRVYPFTQGVALGYGNIGLSARPCATVIGHVLAQPLLVTFLRKRYCFHVLAPTLLVSRPCANIVGITSLQFYVATSSQLLIFPSLFHSFFSLLNCFFVPIFVMPFVRDAFGMIVEFLSLLSSLIFSSLLLAARPNGATPPQPRAAPWV